MAICTNCGADNAPGNNFCMKCGLDLRRSQYAQPPSRRMTQPIGKKRTPIPVIVAIVVVAAIIIIAAIALVAITLENRAILIVWLNSHHANSTIDYRLFVDGQLKRTGLLNPYGSVQIILSIPLNDGSKTVNVYADSTGGEFGTTSDSQNVFLEKHMATSVSLSI